MFKADGTPIKNPAAYAASIKERGYTDPLFTEDGEEIRDPVKFAKRLQGRRSNNADKVAPPRGSDAAGRKRKRGAAAPSGHEDGIAEAAAGLMFKADGNAIRNPAAYVATIEKRGYSDPLFTADGEEIKNPSAFLAAFERRVGGEQEPAQPAGRSRKTGKAAGKGARNNAALLALPPPPSSPGLFKADGTAIKNPSRVVAAIERNGYTEALFTAEGEEVRNPVAFVASMERRAAAGGEAAPEPPAKRRRRGGGKAEEAGEGQLDLQGVLFKEDGTMIQRPAAFLASMEKKGVTEPLFTAEGEEVRNPVAFLAALEKKMAKDSLSASPRAHPEGLPHGLLFKANGAPIKNPEAYVANIETRGYTQPLFTADGAEVRNPAKFLEAQLRRAQDGGEAMTKNPRAKRRAKGNSAPAAPKKRKSAKAASSQVELYKANGARIKNVDAYVAKIEENGYTQPLFTAEGEEIRNPVAYVARGNKMADRQNAVEEAVDRPEGLYKATGERIRNPSAYIAKYEEAGFPEQLYNARGQELRNPVAYVAKMQDNELKAAKRSKVSAMRPIRTEQGKASYYGRVGRGKLASSLMRGAREAVRGRPDGMSQGRRVLGRPMRPGRKAPDVEKSQVVIGRRPAPSMNPRIIN